jgi:hypothetical protein
MYWCLIYCYMFRHLKCHHQGVRYEHAKMVPHVMGGIVHHLSMFISDSLTMTF